MNLTPIDESFINNIQPILDKFWNDLIKLIEENYISSSGDSND